MLRETHLTAQEETIDKFQFIVHFPLLFIGTQKVIERKQKDVAYFRSILYLH